MRFTPQDEEFRAQVRAWLEANLTGPFAGLRGAGGPGREHERTESGSRRQTGLSYLLVPMRQPGITVRPIRQLTGTSEFNEVFFDGARTPAANSRAETIYGGSDEIQRNIIASRALGLPSQQQPRTGNS